MPDVRGDNDAAVRFLRRWRPGGPWLLTAIRTDKKSLDTRTFGGEDVDGLYEWLQKYNGTWNVYFHVNPVMGVLNNKAQREDVASMDWLHVDVDPRVGEDLGDEQRRALSLLTDKLPEGVPPPSVVVFSGGGYQGFWRLEEPYPIEGVLEKAEEAKRWNLQLEILFGADNCHNVDRIMRLPGTVNVPDAKKAKKGRVPALSTVVEFEESRVYPLSDFTPAPQTQIAGDDAFAGPTRVSEVRVSGNVERLRDVDDLDEWGVPDRVKVIVVQGRHPEQPKRGDNSRSAWLFDACCQLVRAGVPDEVIFSVVTDPDFGISDSVLELGSRAERYALRQIGKAKEFTYSPELARLNEKHAVIGNLGGRCRVVEEVYDDGLGRSRLTRQSFDDFRNRYMNETVVVGKDEKGNEKRAKLGVWWLNHPERRQYDRLVFSPGVEASSTAYNLWRGFSCESRPGDCGLFMEHIRKNVCRGREDVYEYLVSWMARAVQKPAVAGEVAIVLKGGRGVGKSVFASEFGEIFGRHFLHISNSGHLVGNFNAHLRDTLVLFADEAFYAGDKKHQSVLKTLITEKVIPIEAKGVDVETAPNYVHLIMASNEDHVIPAGGDERRFLVLDVGQGRQKDTRFFKAMRAQMKDGGREALLHALMSRDISDFEVRDVPRTEALAEQKLLSLGPEEEWWYQKLTNGRLLQDHDKWLDVVVKDALFEDYVDNARRFNVHRRGTATSLGRFLNRVVPGLRTKQIMAKVTLMSRDGYPYQTNKRAYHYVVPALDDCRRAWEEIHGEQDWPTYQQGELPVDEGEDGDVPF